MDGELLIFGWVPLAISVVGVVLSAKCVADHFSRWQLLLFVVSLPPALLAAVGLLQIVRHPMAWPTLLPHACLFLAVLGWLGQMVLLIRAYLKEPLPPAR